MQVAMAAHHAWKQLPAKGDIGGSLASIRQGPDELYQKFVDRLLIAASRILGNSDTGRPFIMQLAYENANANVSHHYPTTQRTDGTSGICPSLCRDWAVR